MHPLSLALAFDGIGEAKRRLTVSSLWQKLGLPGTPGKSCRSPFRDDHGPSFSVYADDTRWKDHATGEKGDALDFLAKALNRPVGDTVGVFLEWAGVPRPLRENGGAHGPRSSPRLRPPFAPVSAPDTAGATPRFANRPPYPPLAAMVERIEGPHRPLFTPPVLTPLGNLPPLKGGTPDQLDALKMARGLPSKRGLILAESRGVLGFATVRDAGADTPAWFITDARGVNAQARRLDGTPWRGLPGTPKARTWKGACAAWPIGTPDAAPRPRVILCEGGPDALAAFSVIAHYARHPEAVAVITMTGAGQRMHPEALALLRGKTVRIVPHLDKAGATAAARWDAELTAAGASVEWFDLRPFVPEGGKDLNDALAHDPGALAPLVRFAGDETEGR